MLLVMIKTGKTFYPAVRIGDEIDSEKIPVYKLHFPSESEDPSIHDTQSDSASSLTDSARLS